jgi:hypothetical protein
MCDTQTSAIDDVHRTLLAITDDDEKIKEGKEIVAQLAALKYELQHDRKLTLVFSARCGYGW